MKLPEKNRYLVYFPRLSTKYKVLGNNNLNQLITSPMKYQKFIQSATLNPSGGNWKLYHYKLNGDNYQSFLYAFVIMAKYLDPQANYVYQFERNAKMLSRCLKKRSIPLCTMEKSLLRYCKNFSSWKSKFVSRDKKINAYFIFFIHHYL